MDFASAIQTINKLLREKQPPAFSSSWIREYAPYIYRFIQKDMRTENELYVVQHLLGHRDSRMTQSYAHLRVDDLRDAVETLEQGAQKGAKSA